MVSTYRRTLWAVGGLKNQYFEVPLGARCYITRKYVDCRSSYIHKSAFELQLVEYLWITIQLKAISDNSVKIRRGQCINTKETYFKYIWGEFTLNWRHMSVMASQITDISTFCSTNHDENLCQFQQQPTDNISKASGDLLTIFHGRPSPFFNPDQPFPNCHKDSV